MAAPSFPVATPSTIAPPKTRLQIAKLGIYALCVALLVIFLFPIFWSLLTSFKPTREALAAPSTGLPSRLVFDNYLKLNAYGAGIGQYTFNSVAVAIFTVIGAITLSTLGGFGFSRFQFQGKSVLFLMILATLMIPFQSILTPL